MPESKSKSASTTLERCSSEELVNKLAVWATDKRLPFVVYRLPNENHFQVQIGSNICKVDGGDLSELKSGFLFSSYSGENYFINNGLSINSRDRKLEVSVDWPVIISLESLVDGGESWQPYTIGDDTAETRADEYIEHVERCIEEIKHSELIKVVPSRTKRIVLKESQSLSKILLWVMITLLCHVQTNAHLFCYQVTDTQNQV